MFHRVKTQPVVFRSNHTRGDRHAVVRERSNLSQLAIGRPPQLIARPRPPSPNVGVGLGQQASGTDHKKEKWSVLNSYRPFGTGSLGFNSNNNGSRHATKSQICDRTSGHIRGADRVRLHQIRQASESTRGSSQHRLDHRKGQTQVGTAVLQNDQRIFANPELPLSVRFVVQRYMAEKIRRAGLASKAVQSTTTNSALS